MVVKVLPSLIGVWVVALDGDVCIRRDLTHSGGVIDHHIPRLLHVQHLVQPLNGLQYFDLWAVLVPCTGGAAEADEENETKL